MRRLATQLRAMISGLPPVRGLLPLALLLAVWQLVQPMEWNSLRPLATAAAVCASDGSRETGEGKLRT